VIDGTLAVSSLWSTALNGVYTMMRVRRTPVQRTCAPYMYHSVKHCFIFGLPL